MASALWRCIAAAISRAWCGVAHKAGPVSVLYRSEGDKLDVRDLKWLDNSRILMNFRYSEGRGYMGTGVPVEALFVLSTDEKIKHLNVYERAGRWAPMANNRAAVVDQPGPAAKQLLLSWTTENDLDRHGGDSSSVLALNLESGAVSRRQAGLSWRAPLVGGCPGRGAGGHEGGSRQEPVAGAWCWKVGLRAPAPPGNRSSRTGNGNVGRWPFGAR